MATVSTGVTCALTTAAEGQSSDQHMEHMEHGTLSHCLKADRAFYGVSLFIRTTNSTTKQWTDTVKYPCIASYENSTVRLMLV